MSHTILLVDDNVDLLLSMKRALAPEYKVEVVRRGEHALQKLNQMDCQCVLLDLTLPDMPGLDVCRKLRRNGNTVPVIVLSGDHQATHKAALLDAGADDYLTKPASLIELKARLRSAIRRTYAQSHGSRLEMGGVSLDSLQHIVKREGSVIKLRPKEFALLECLMGNAGRVVSRVVLLQYAWDGTSDGWTNVVDVHIKHLRDKIDQPFDVPLIKTVHGIGYKFDASNVAKTTKGGRR